MSKLIDYTQMRRNSKLGGGQILPCLKCGRKGLSFKLVNTFFIHTSEKTLEGIKMIDYCTIKNHITMAEIGAENG